MQLTFTSVWNFFPTKIFTATWMVFEPGVEGQVMYSILELWLAYSVINTIKHRVNLAMCFIT